jgi:hypothetical protein
MSPLYSWLAALGLACLASTAILHMRARSEQPARDEFDGYAWS